MASTRMSNDSIKNFPDFTKLRTFMDNPLCDASVTTLLSEISIVELVQSLDTREVADAHKLYELILEVLEKLLKYGNIRKEFFKNESIIPLLFEAVGSPYTPIRKLLSSELKIIIDDKDGIELVLQKNLFDLVVTLFLDDDLGVSEQSSAALIKMLLKETKTSEIFFETRIIQKIMQKFEAGGEDIKLRIAAFFVQISNNNEVLLFEKSKNTNIFDRILEIYMSNDDILLNMNLLEILETLSTNPQAMQYLEEKNFPQTLLKNLDDSLFDTMKISIVNFLTNSITLHPESASKIISSSSCSFVRTIEDFIDTDVAYGDEISNKLCAISSWCSIASTVSGRQLLEKFYPNLITKVTAMTQSGFVKDRIFQSALMGWLTVLEKGEDVLLSLKKEIIVDLLPKLMKELMLQPFKEPRMLIFKILTAVCDLPEVLRAYLQSCPHRDLLMDNRSEDFSTVQSSKFEFVRKVSSFSTLVEDITSKEYLEKLEKYVAAGPFSALSDGEMKVDEMAT